MMGWTRKAYETNSASKVPLEGGLMSEIERRQEDMTAARKAIDHIIEERVYQKQRWTVMDDQQRSPGE